MQSFFVHFDVLCTFQNIQLVFFVIFIHVLHIFQSQSFTPTISKSDVFKNNIYNPDIIAYYSQSKIKYVASLFT